MTRKMSKKHKLSTIKSIWFYLHNPNVSLMKSHFNNEFFMRFWEFIQSGLNKHNSYPPQKEVLNYITSRNMRKTLIPSDFLNENKVPIQLGKKSIFPNRRLNLDPLNFQQTKKYLMNPIFVKMLKFHSKTLLRGNLVSKQFANKESPEEFEKSWGGPEILKLIIIMKSFDEIIEKHPEILVFFSAYWCNHCLRLRKPFGSAALMAKQANLPVRFAMFDVTVDPDVAIEKGIVGIPVLKYYKEGKFVATYKGKRTAEDLFEFVKNPPPPTPESNKGDI